MLHARPFFWGGGLVIRLFGTFQIVESQHQFVKTVQHKHTRHENTGKIEENAKQRKKTKQ
jgi:hypothetical protein